LTVRAFAARIESNSQAGPEVAQLTVRKVDPEIVRRLKLRAAQHGRSVEAEHRAILERLPGNGADDIWAAAARLRARTRGRQHTDSAELIRADRDRRADLDG
jgi:antitoxin FitA